MWMFDNVNLLFMYFLQVVLDENRIATNPKPTTELKH